MTEEVVELDVELSREEDGLWRAEVPELPGCWCDAASLEEALADIQNVVKLVLASDRRHGLSLPERVARAAEIRLRLALPVTAA